MTDGQALDRALKRRRGQPLVFLATVVLVWSLTRFVQYWPGDQLTVPSQQSPSLSASLASTATAMMSVPNRLPVVPIPRLDGRVAGPSPAPSSPPSVARALPFDVAMAHQQLWIESLSLSTAASAGPGRSPLIDRPLMLLQDPDASLSSLPPGVPIVRPGSGRWSVYGWSLLRQGGQSRTLAPAAQYGGSQAGLMVQMALAQVPQRPMLYARATTALASADDRSLALGLSGRPFSQLPVDLAVERRFAPARGQADRFAALVVAGGAWTPRHSRIRLEGYGQAGVVGLADPQAFFDLQMLATRPVYVTDALSVSLGGGLWAGGQQNIDAQGRKPWAHRIDLGPRAAVSVPVEKGSLSLALDWRQRIDGDADPGSGAALTLSAGF